MKIQVTPHKLEGTVTAPPSKSMAHRLLICGGLAPGETSVIRGISTSDDISATLSCLSSLGVVCERQEDAVKVSGIDIRKAVPASTLTCHESGSTLRFFLPLCLMSGSPATLCGTQKLLSRPLEVYENLCREKGIFYRHSEKAVEVRGKLPAGEYRIPGNISSQFISGLLFSLPLCDGDSSISIIPPIESRSYLSLTIDALSKFGIDVRWTDEKTIYVKGNQTYRPANVTVEGDYSNAAFFAALEVLGHKVSVSGLAENSLQGDKTYQKYFQMLSKGTPTIHIGDCPDLGPILMAVAAAKNGAVFCGTKRLKMKESDRGAAMAEELSKFGVSVTLHEASIVVYPVKFHAPAAPLCGHNDHRIVMALTTLLTLTGGTLNGAEAVKKSLPEYFELMKNLGAEMIIDETEAESRGK